MTCADLGSLISAYADGELRPAQREVVELHLERCAICQTYLVDHQRIRQLLMAESCSDWTPDLRETLAPRLRRERVGSKVKRQRSMPWRHRRRVVGITSLALAALSGFLAGHAVPPGSLPGRDAGSLALDRAPAACVRQALPAASTAGADHVVLVLTCAALRPGSAVLLLPNAPVTRGMPPARQVYLCADVGCVQETVRLALGTMRQEARQEVISEDRAPRAPRGAAQML